jgi:membrane protease YdiL (CAAX protease family)
MNPLNPLNTSPEHQPLEQNLNAASTVPVPTTYLRTTRTLTYSFLFTLPLFILYEVGVFVINIGSTSGVRIGADVLIRQLLGMIGLHGTYWLAILVLITGIAIITYERRYRIPLRPGWFGLMLGESALYAIILGMVVGTFVSQLFGLSIPPLQIAGRGSLAEGLVLSLGAGIYEELVFRLILVSALVALLRILPLKEKARSAIAMVIAALIFSWVHYIGSLGDTFTLSSFTFRFLMGLALNGLFLLRGFGVAAMTHALYDVFVTLMLM